MDRPLRVVQWGTGNTGSVALPAIAATQGLDLIGVCAHDQNLAGREAGELMKSGSLVGVPVWGDASVVASFGWIDCFNDGRS